MKDIPFFIAEHGVAGLSLEQVPYTRCAYITLQSTENPEKLLEECAAFCRAVGAERIFACNHDFLKSFPVHTQILEMRWEKDVGLEPSLRLVPVGEEQAEEFCRLYNEKMRGVKTAGHMDRVKLRGEKAFFVCDGDAPVGIGILREDTVAAVASLKKGAGKEIMRALCAGIPGPSVRLEVASENRKALALYTSMGFQITAVKNTWYEII